MRMCDPASKCLKCITAHPCPIKFLQSCAPVLIAWAGPAHLSMVTAPVLIPSASAVKELIITAVSVQAPPVLRAAGVQRRGPLEPQARQGTVHLGHQDHQARQPATGLPYLTPWPSQEHSRFIVYVLILQ